MNEIHSMNITVYPTTLHIVLQCNHILNPYYRYLAIFKSVLFYFTNKNEFSNQLKCSTY